MAYATVCTRPLRFAGIDPGRNCGIALVEAHPSGRPVLVGTWAVYGVPHLWFRRLRRALEDCALLALDGGDLGACWVEDWTAVTRGARQRQSAWIGLGRSQGAVMMTWHHLTQHLPHLVPSTNDDPRRTKNARAGWTNILHVPSGKMGDGSHRIREASRLVRGAAAALQATSSARELDVAEAILIAAAAAIQHRIDEANGRILAASHGKTR